eukprot:CAMPEP_0181058046 /NCGR_PEP_ID=MMETSP1070-20121207/20590_1 /TAXON_ID=265543 /ORGANISM="Minutocellus polymorphus, Strain NH13" /LENGTH=211 /DNA_ID=CAMNT_0023137531 /DNA_START=65 /DNA_END=700 /DNA_ORIENTATION=+
MTPGPAIKSAMLFVAAFSICVASVAAAGPGSSAITSPVKKLKQPSFLGQRKSPSCFLDSHLDIPRGGGRNDEPDAPKLSIWSEKKHPVLGTTCLKPIMYPTLDGLIQLAVFPLAHLCLTGKAKELQLFLLWRIHTPLYFLTNYGTKFFLPNLPLVPLWVMYTVDVCFALFNLISPFVIDGYGALKYLYGFGFGMGVFLFGFFDPFPAASDE